MPNSPSIKFCPLALRRLCRRTGWFIAAAAGLTVLMAHWHSATAAPGRSTTIALTSDETRVVVVNRGANSLSIIRVKCRRKIEMTPGVQSRDDTPVGGGHDRRPMHHAEAASVV